MGADALSAFLNNQIVGEQLNKIHLVVGGISPTAPQGVGTAQFIGTLYRPYVSIYGYAEAYEDEATNALKPMVGRRMSSSGVRNHRQSPATAAWLRSSKTARREATADLKFVPRKLATPKEDRTELRIVSRPCLIPYDWRAGR